jgi:hypothetical protein
MDGDEVMMMGSVLPNHVPCSLTLGSPTLAQGLLQKRSAEQADLSSLIGMRIVVSGNESLMYSMKWLICSTFWACRVVTGLQSNWL